MNSADLSMDERFMRRALALARKGLGRTSPNPAVGAVIVKDGEVVAAGYHHAAGKPHAEIEALQKAGRNAVKGTMYVTLEPCNHYGRTPPCTRAIVESGLRCVVVGMKDPNPNVAGGGCEMLRKSGIEVREGILEMECRKLNEAFTKYISTGTPMVTAKTAMTLDGFTATSTGDSKWITGENSRRLVHRMRDGSDAIMVGVGTVIADNPRLTVRAVRRTVPQPYRIVVDTHLKTPRDAAVVACGDPERTIIAVGKHVPASRLEQYLGTGVHLLECPEVPEGIDMGALLGILAAREIVSVLVEGGAGLLGTMLRERLIDKIHVFRAPLLLGGSDGVPMASGSGPSDISKCIKLNEPLVKRMGQDVLTVGYPVYPD